MTNDSSGVEVGQ